MAPIITDLKKPKENLQVLLRAIYNNMIDSVAWKRCQYIGVCTLELDLGREGPGSNPTITCKLHPSAKHFNHIAARDPGVYM